MQGAVGLLAKIVGGTVDTHCSGGCRKKITLCPSFCWRGTTLCSSGGSVMAGVGGSRVLLTNALSCCARVRITVKVCFPCAGFVKVSFNFL